MSWIKNKRNYCITLLFCHSLITIIRMFCSKASYKKAEQIQKRGLRIVCSQPHMSLEELIIRDQAISAHRKQILYQLKSIKHFQGKSLFYEKHFHEKRCNIQSKNIKSFNPTQSKYKKVWSLLFQFSCQSLMEST